VREAEEPAYYQQCKAFDLNSLAEINPQQALPKLLASPNIASKKWIYSQYDYQVMTNTAIVPGDGDAAVLRLKGTRKGVALVTDCNSRMVFLDPYQGGMMAVCEAARNLACVGAQPLALTNCLNFGNPEKPNIYWQMKHAIAGMSAAARALDTPVVSGNVSLFNETAQGAIYPTPVVGMVGLLKDIDQRCDMAFKGEGDLIILLGRFRDELGGSEYLSVCHGLETGAVPEVNLEDEKALLQLLQILIQAGMLQSCHDISEGGLAVTVAESAIKGQIGCDIKINSGLGRVDGLLFSEAPGRVVASLRRADMTRLVEMVVEQGVEMRIIGEVGGPTLICEDNGTEIIKLSMQEAAAIWEGAIGCLMK
jgi:phosphoribosylformylglycinamidine synthase